MYVNHLTVIPTNADDSMTSAALTCETCGNFVTTESRSRAAEFRADHGDVVEVSA